MESKHPTLGNSIRMHGEEPIEDYLKLWLIDLNASVNLKRPLNESQMDFVSMQIILRYRSLKLSDIYLIFMKAKCGDYGELYERLSPDKILLWFSEYSENRINLAGEISRMKSDGHKQGAKRSTPVMEEIHRRVGSMSSGMNALNNDKLKTKK